MKPEKTCWWLFEPRLDRATYIHQLLDCYRRTPTVTAKATGNDRRLAARLYSDQIPLRAVQAAFILAASRRRGRSPQEPPLQPIRSLYYFLPVIDEILDTPIDPEYFGYLKNRLVQEIGPFW